MTTGILLERLLDLGGQPKFTVAAPTLGQRCAESSTTTWRPSAKPDQA